MTCSDDSSVVVRWAAMNPAGEVQGTVDLPATFQVTEIGPDYVLGLQGEPATGLRQIRAYRLQR